MPTPKARYEIWADDKSAQAWKSALGHANQFSSKLKSILLPVASGAAIAGLARESLNMADAVGDAADRAGVLASEMSRLKYVAEQSDVSFESLEVSVKKYQKTVSEAANGSKEATETLQALGISVDQLRGRKLDDQLGIIADAFQGVIDPADRTRLAMELFGKSGTDLLPMLGRGADGINELSLEADRLGITLDDRATKAIDRSSKALDRFWASIKGGTANALGGIIADFSGGSGDQILELQHQIELIQKMRDSKNDDTLSAEYQQLRSRAYDIEIRKIQSQIDVLQDLSRVRTEAAALSVRLISTEKTAVDALGASVTKSADETAKHLAAQKKAREDEREARFDADIRALKNNADVELRLSESLTDNLQQDREEMAERVFATQSYYFDLANDKAKETTDEMSEYAKSAAQNMQSAFADFLYDPFEGGMKGMLSSFVDTMRRMVAEAASAKIFESIFGKSGASDLIGAGLGFLFGGGGGSAATGGAFSGPRAMGGPVAGGMSYLVGERGPELFTPSSSGAITPNHAMGGNVVNVSYNIDARGATTELIRELPKILKQQGEALESKIIEKLSRRQYALN